MIKLLIVTGVVLVGLGILALWRRHTPLNPGSIARRASVPKLLNLRKTPVLIALGLLVCLALGTVVIIRAWWPKRQHRTVAQVKNAPATTSTPATAILQRFPQEYPSVTAAKKTTPTPDPAAADLPPKGVPVQKTATDLMARTAPPQNGQKGLSPEETMLIQELRGQIAALTTQNADLTQAVRTMQSAQTHHQQGQQATGQTAQAAPQKQEVKDPRTNDWEFLAKPPTRKEGATLTAEQQQELAAKTQAHPLVETANLVIPEKPLRTIYRSQHLVARLVDNINSDIPAKNIKMEVIEPLYDKFGYYTLLAEVGSIVIASQEGTTSFGQERIPLKVEQIELPWGGILAVESTVGDEHGAAGVTGKVNAHIPQLLLAAGINAVMNIGLGYAAGTPGRGQYYQDPAQQAVQDAGRSVANDVNSFSRQVLKRPPTIEVDAKNRKKPKIVTIEFLKNIQLREQANTPVVRMR